MADPRERIKSELRALYKEGSEILVAEIKRHADQKDDGSKRRKGTKANDEPRDIRFSYQSWYTKCLPVMRELAPDRYEEFQTRYYIVKRKNITADTYTVRDYLLGLRVKNALQEEIFDSFAAFVNNFSDQLAILGSVLDRLDTVLSDIRGVLQAELFDSELDAAEHLLKNGHFRAAGTVGGVTLEAHLDEVSRSHVLKVNKKNPGISDFNDTLKKGGVIDVPVWRRIQGLADIRNLCTHKKKRDPTKEEVIDLIDGVKRIIKSVF